MGDRANVVISNGRGQAPVYLYTHWGGCELPKDLQEALSRRQRWDDDAYLARIIFDTMTKGSHGSETGHGIATSPPDNEHDWLVVNCEERTVSRTDRSGRNPITARVVGHWSFERFIEIDIAQELVDY